MLLPFVVCALVAAAASVDAPAQPSGADAFETLLKLKGEAVPGTFSLVVPHPELRIVAGGFRLTPALGVRSSFSFTPGEKEGFTAVGELALLLEEGIAISAAAQKAGFRIVSQDSHFVDEEPKLLYLHLEARGPEEELTEKARGLLDLLREGRLKRGLQPGPTKLPNELDAPALGKLLGAKGSPQEGTLRFTLPWGGWAVFSGTMEKAAVAAELPAALAPKGFQKTAAHGERAHFWGVGKAADLAWALAARR